MPKTQDLFQTSRLKSMIVPIVFEQLLVLAVGLALRRRKEGSRSTQSSRNPSRRRNSARLRFPTSKSEFRYVETSCPRFFLCLFERIKKAYVSRVPNSYERTRALSEKINVQTTT